MRLHLLGRCSPRAMAMELKALHLGLFFSGLVIGATSSWLGLFWRQSSATPASSAPAPPQVSNPDTKEEEDEELEEYDSDEELSEAEEVEAEANPHKLVRC